MLVKGATGRIPLSYFPFLPLISFCSHLNLIPSYRLLFILISLNVHIILSGVNLISYLSHFRVIYIYIYMQFNFSFPPQFHIVWSKIHRMSNHLSLYLRRTFVSTHRHFIFISTSYRLHFKLQFHIIFPSALLSYPTAVLSFVPFRYHSTTHSI